jgi:CO/xanthine dehydrogenase Mo-binding subunit
MDGVAPAISNAIYHATGARLHKIPVTPERVWRALNGLADATWLM